MIPRQRICARLPAPSCDCSARPSTAAIPSPISMEGEALQPPVGRDRKMIQLKKSDSRGPTRTSWLISQHSFSFGDYYDPNFTGFRDLLVINEDRVAPSAGFPPHSHRDMEILSYVIAGELEHRDSLGNGAILRPGELQRMSAGTGIRHSEFNPSAVAPVHFLQIWVRPERAGLKPGYEQKTMPPSGGVSRLDLIGSRDGRNDTITIHQDVDLYRATLHEDQPVGLNLRAGRAAWVQIIKGQAQVNDVDAAAGDGLAVSDEAVVRLHGHKGAELLIFDLV